MNRRSLIVIASIGMVALVFPPSALAASTTALDGDFGVQFLAAPGEVNTVTVTNDAQTFIINDSTADVSAGAGCFNVDAHTVQCYTDHEWELDLTLLDMNDTLSVQTQADLFVTAGGGDGADHLSALSGRVSFGGEKGVDTMTGADQNDYMEGGPGADVLRGGAGRDDLNGDAGADTIYGASGRDWLNGGDGADQLYGGADNDTVYGGGGADHARGGGGADRIYGGNNITPDPTDRGDWLYGGAGGDLLFGGPGLDHLFGGIGSDSCRTQTGGGTTKSC